ncbi:MAG TPA: calcium-binding protein [Gemmata sp.]
MAKSKPKEDPEREERIAMEIVVDCYNEDEQAADWYAYIEDQLQFPVRARCVAKRSVSPLRVKDEVEVTGIAPDEECGSEIFVTIRWEKDGLAVPLAQLEPIKADPETEQAVADWHYWVARGYQF